MSFVWKKKEYSETGGCSNIFEVKLMFTKNDYPDLNSISEMSARQLFDNLKNTKMIMKVSKEELVFYKFIKREEKIYKILNDLNVYVPRLLFSNIPDFKVNDSDNEIFNDDEIFLDKFLTKKYILKKGFNSQCYLILEKWNYCLIDYLYKQQYRLTELDKNNLIIDIALSILNILEILHNLGLTHNDIKPENILSQEKNFKNPTLIDYGFVCKTGTKNVLGTLLFNSRDTHNGISTYRSDLESLFYTLYEILFEHLPWEAVYNEMDIKSGGAIDDIDSDVKNDKRTKILDMKNSFFDNNLTNLGIIQPLYIYIKELGIEEKINFEIIKDMFLKKMHNH